MEIVIDREFEQLIPPLTEEEYTGLEQDIIANGVKVPVMVWEQPDGTGILIDGHNRYHICQRQNIPFNVQPVEISSRNEALQMILSLQLNRRNLTSYSRAELALRYEDILKAEAKKRQGTRTDLQPENIPEIFPGSSASGETREQIGKLAGLSGKTIDSVKKIQSTVSPQLLKKLRSGELSINQAAQLIKLDNADRQLVENRILQGEDVKSVLAGIKKRPAFVSINSGKAEWYTPAVIINAARAVMGTIDLDPASTEEANTVIKADHYYTAEEDGLKKEWHGNIWLNPPYGNPEIRLFIEKLLESDVDQACILVNSATETGWFQNLLEHCNAVVFIRGRLAFWGTFAKDREGTKGLQGQAIFYVGSNVEKFKKTFADFGKVVILNNA